MPARFILRNIACSARAWLGMALLLPAPVLAQGYAEGVGVSTEYLPLRLTREGSPAFGCTVFRANVVVPLSLPGPASHSLLVGANLESLRFAGEPSGLGNVYGLSPLLGYRRTLTDRWELTAVALPALNSDLRGVRGADVTWGGVLRATYRSSPRLAYRTTAGYRQQFYGPQYVLLLGLDWQPGTKWRLFGDLPTTFTASYAVLPRVNTGFNLTGINTAYRLREQPQYFQYQQGHYGAFVEGHLSTHWVLRATAAYALTRRLGVYAQDEQWPATIDYIGLGKPPLPLSPEIAKGWAFRIALSYRVPAP